MTYGGGLYVHPPGQPWMVGEVADHPTLLHDGSALSYRAVMWAMPGADVGLVLLANANNYSDQTQLPRGRTPSSTCCSRSRHRRPCAVLTL